DVDRRVHPDHAEHAASPLRHRPQRVDVNVLPPQGLRRRFLLRARGDRFTSQQRDDVVVFPVDERAAGGCKQPLIQRCVDTFRVEPRGRIRPLAPLAPAQPAGFLLVVPLRVPLLPRPELGDPALHFRDATGPVGVVGHAVHDARTDLARRERRGDEILGQGIQGGKDNARADQDGDPAEVHKSARGRYCASKCKAKRSGRVEENLPVKGRDKAEWPAYRQAPITDGTATATDSATVYGRSTRASPWRAINSLNFLTIPARRSPSAAILPPSPPSPISR